jgi:hypothetical protein
MFKAMVQKDQIALLGTYLIRPLEMYLEIATKRSEIERELARDPKPREIYNQISIEPFSESPRQALKIIRLDDYEKEFHRDEQFAALIESARKKFLGELRDIRRKLQDDRLLLKEFSAAVTDSDGAAILKDVFSALKRLGEFSKPTVGPSNALMQEAEEFAAILR